MQCPVSLICIGHLLIYMPTWALRNLLTLMWRLHIYLGWCHAVGFVVCQGGLHYIIRNMQALLSFFLPACLVLLFGNVLVTHPLFNLKWLSSLVLSVYIYKYSHHNSWAGLCTMHYAACSLLHLSLLAQMNGLVHHLLGCISIWGTNLTC